MRKKSRELCEKHPSPIRNRLNRHPRDSALDLLVNLPVKVREVVSLIEKDGWRRVSSKGGHRQYKHPTKKGRVTISGQFKDDIHPKTLGSVLKQAGLE